MSYSPDLQFLFSVSIQVINVRYSHFQNEFLFMFTFNKLKKDLIEFHRVGIDTQKKSNKKCFSRIIMNINHSLDYQIKNLASNIN